MIKGLVERLYSDWCLPQRMTALGRLRPVVIVRELGDRVTCYAGPNGRVRLRADIAVRDRYNKIRP
jgi:hypothetical protein